MGADWVECLVCEWGEAADGSLEEAGPALARHRVAAHSASLGDVSTDELVAGICATAGVVDQAIRDARRCRAAGARRTAIRVELIADDELRRLLSLCVELRSRLA